MGFHGYRGHTSCIIGECSTADCPDCPDGPEIHSRSHGSTPCARSHGHFHPERIIVPCHRNDGPVDLSQYCTPTGRGTWSIGGQRASRQASTHVHIQGTSSDITRSQHQLVSTTCPDKQTNFVDDTTQFGEARLYQSTSNVDIPRFIADGTHAKNDRSTNDIDRIELEMKASALLDLVRAMVFPIPVYHENSHLSANFARILGVGKASEVSPSIISAHRVNSDSKGWYGVYGDTTHPIGNQEPETNYTSEEGSKPSFKKLSSVPDSCCKNDDKIHNV